MRLQRFLAAPILSMEGLAVTGLDVVVAAVLDGEWQQLESRLTGAVDARAAAAPVEGSVVAFRYARRLISAADFRVWLEARWLNASDVEDYLASASEAGSSPIDQAARQDRLYVWASCGGVLARAADTLRQGLIAAVSWGSADAGPAASRTRARVRAWWCASPLLALITEADLLASTQRVTGMAWSLDQLATSIATPAAVARSVQENSAKWERIGLQSLTFASMSAAREAQLQLAEGVPVGNLEEFALDSQQRSFFLEDACPELQAELLAPHHVGATYADLIRRSLVWLETGCWRAGLVTARTAADPGDERVLLRAREHLMTAELDRLGAGRVVAHAAL